MLFEQQCIVALPREEVWELLLDIPRVAGCVPGVSKVELTGPQTYNGAMNVQVGPIRLTMEGTITLLEQDKENWQATLRTEAAERKVGGGLSGETRLRLAEHGAGETELIITTDAALLGKLGEFGQPIIKKKAEGMLQQFAKNLQQMSAKEGA